VAFRQLFWTKEPDDRFILFVEIIKIQFPNFDYKIFPNAWHQEASTIGNLFQKVHDDIQTIFVDLGGNNAIKADFAKVANTSVYRGELFQVYGHQKYYEDTIGYFRFIPIDKLAALLKRFVSKEAC